MSNEQPTLAGDVINEQYLGDGVYIVRLASWESGWKIYTWNGEEETNRVFFERETMDALLKYLGASRDAKPEQEGKV